MRLPSYLLGQVSKAGRRHLQVTLTEHALKLPHYAVLCALSDHGPSAQQELAVGLDLDKSHVARFVDELSALGLVVREPDLVDRRRHSVRLTDAGVKTLKELQPAADGAQAEFLSVLTPGERTTLLALLNKVLDAHDTDRAGEKAATA
jgi:DNA-binding MarR family transcriptional regulator